MKYLIGFIAGTLACYLLLFTSKNTVAIKDITCPKNLDVKEKIHSCPKLRRDNKQDVTKAFLLFLASLGIKNSGQHKQAIEKIIKDPTLEIAVQVAASPKQRSKQYLDQAFNILKQARELFSSEEISWGQIKIASENLLKEPTLFHAISKYIKDPKHLTKVNGFYTGSLYRMGGKYKGEIEEVNLTINFSIKDDNKVDGSFKMVLIRDGHAYSNSVGEGSNGDVRINSTNSRSVIIESSPTTFFHFRTHELKNANVYEDGKFIGIASLHRTN
jgi:hypothetical protein